MFITFYNFMLPEYEKNCMAEYANNDNNKFIFAKTGDEKFTELVSTMKEFTQRQEFEKFLDIIRMEEKEIEAFKNCLTARDSYETKKNKANSVLKEL